MDIKRAAEITKLPDMIEVTYHGGPIYIEEVNPDRDTAMIHYLDQPRNSQEVSVSQLVEAI